MVTRVGPDIPDLSVLDGIQLKAIPHEYSTTFENIYENGQRRQILSAYSGPLTIDDVPLSWRSAPLVHLAPIAQEYSPALYKCFPNSLVCATVQGWLRSNDEQNNVIFKPHADIRSSLTGIDILVMSVADVFGDHALLKELLTQVRIGVETLGPEGCRIFHQGDVISVPVEPAEEIDPTGAGDIFAAAFFIQYEQSRDIISAAQFANACASMSVGRIGVLGTPTLPEVEQRVAQMYK
ncbi:MAG: PfkB family carbohydrate kinase [Chloroflexota bacterium]